MIPPIIDRFITPNFRDLEYTFDFIIELGITITFLFGLLIIVWIQRKNRLLASVGGKEFLIAFSLFFIEALMNFIDGNLIWFNETTPLFPWLLLPAYQLWRLIRFILVLLAYYYLIRGFKKILEKANILYGMVKDE